LVSNANFLIQPMKDYIILWNIKLIPAIKALKAKERIAKEDQFVLFFMINNKRDIQIKTITILIITLVMATIAAE
jgi:hypothetical protein